MNVVALLRVSTKGQGESGLGLEAQREYIAQAAQANGWNIVDEYIDVGVSGSVHPLERPAASKAFATGLTVVCAKLDRLSRDVEHIAGLMKRYNFKVATMPHAKTLELHLYAMLAEQERAFISQRTKDALAALKDRAEAGDTQAQTKINNRAEVLVRGRTDANRALARAAVDSRVTSFHESIRSEFEACLYRGQKSLRAVADCLNARNVTTSRGGQWSAVQVSRVMQSLQLSFPE